MAESGVSRQRIGPIEATIDESLRLVTVVSLEDPSIDEWTAALETIQSHASFRPGFAFLSDRRAVAAPASPAFVQAAARYLSARPEVFGSTRWAVVTTGGVGYGMARMGQLYVGDAGPLIEIFKDRESALAWLAEDSGGGR